jgi:octaprenyl-diphosphate synthase
MALDQNKEKPHDILSDLLKEELKAVNQLIHERMTSEYAPRIPEIASHLINAGGKKLRPLLTLATAKMCGYHGSYHIYLAAIVEFIHTATLLHDDVVDESDQRRGKPSANLLWDNKSSVLVGDYLFSRSFQLMVETGSLQVLDILANASATIAEGEVLQLTVSRDISTNEETYLKVVRGKTAALFSAATQVGAVISEAEIKTIDALFYYGDALGIAFQIVDDLLDVVGDSKIIGKNNGDDFRERKLTLPFIKTISSCELTEKDFWKRTIEKGDQTAEDFDTALRLMEKYESIEKTRLDAMKWAKMAQKALDGVPDHSIKTILFDLADYVVERVK